MLRAVWALKGQRPTALGHHRFQWLYVTAFVCPTTGETAWQLTDGVSKPLFAALPAALALAVGAGPRKRVVLLRDNAGFHTRQNLAVPDGITLVHLSPHSPEPQPAETLWPLVDEPIVNGLVPNLDELVDTVGGALLRPRRASDRDQLTHRLRLMARKSYHGLISRRPYHSAACG